MSDTSDISDTFDMSDISDMSVQSGSSRLRVLFEAALQDYEQQTGIALAKHPLAKQLQNYDSVESVIAVLREQTEAFNEFRGKDRVIMLLKNAASALYKVSAAADFGQAIGLVRP
jgi:4-hydroxy-L-threonine phosphate dehydrogenase PdxA